MAEKKAKTPEGIEYKYYECKKCGEEILDMKQLHKVAEKYRSLKTYHAKLSKWGLSLGLRIPQSLVKKYQFSDKVAIIPQKEGILVVRDKSREE
ncbi:MAG: hypothetical protein ABIB71_00800 [Candidatus Woesearchaeota archaeon]